MERIIRRNTKARVNLTCPECGMDLTKAPNGGFAKGNDTFCCEGCANGTGCTCSVRAPVKKSFNRPGDIGWRNSENRAHDKNFNAEKTTSSEPIGKRRHATAHEYKSRDQRQWDPRSKRLKTQNKPMDSQRTQARGQSEERGNLAGTRGGDRVSRTGTKGK